MHKNRRRLSSSGFVLLVATVLMSIMPGGTVSATPLTTGTVPDVVTWGMSDAIAAVQNAGFVASTTPGSVDCGPPFVQSQLPVGGTIAELGSTVVLKINRQPTRGDMCP